MVETKFSLEYSEIRENRNGLPVILVAGGHSSRMGGMDKLFCEIAGIPVIVRSMLAFENSPMIRDIYVVTRPESMPTIQNLANRYMISKLRAFADAGSCRQESVKQGILLLEKSAERALIHDAARPLVSQALIERLCCASSEGCTVCAVPLKDTVKQVKDGRVLKTLQRDSLLAVQTPQSVPVKRYMEVLNDSSDLSVFTDDASVLESVGEPVYIVDGEETNLKITTPLDLAIAQVLLRQEDQKEL